MTSKMITWKPVTYWAIMWLFFHEDSQVIDQLQMAYTKGA